MAYSSLLILTCILIITSLGWVPRRANAAISQRSELQQKLKQGKRQSLALQLSAVGKKSPVLQPGQKLPRLPPQHGMDGNYEGYLQHWRTNFIEGRSTAFSVLTEPNEANPMDLSKTRREDPDFRNSSMLQKCDVKAVLKEFAHKYRAQEILEQIPKSCDFEDTFRKPLFSRRMVLDVFAEDVSIVALATQNYSTVTPPVPILSSEVAFRRMCDVFTPRWGVVCPKNRLEDAPFKTPKWFQCDYRNFIASVDCAAIGTEGEVFDATRVFSAHAVGHKVRDYFPDDNINALSEFHGVIAHHFMGASSSGIGHFLNQLARLFFLLVVLPDEIPILVPDFRLARDFKRLLLKTGVISSSERLLLVQSPVRKHFAAHRVLFTAEAAHCEHSALCSSGWYSMQTEVCSWQMSLPRAIQREIMHCALGISNVPHSRVRILVVDRRDAESRFLSNHIDVMKSLRERFRRSAKFVEFVGSRLPLETQIRLFAWADVVIAPHGAALGHTVYMQPGSCVIEIGYPQPSMPGIFMASRHGTSLVANINDLLQVSQKAVLFMLQHRVNPTGS